MTNHRILLTAALLLATATAASAQNTGTQTFTATVPVNITITPPPADATLTHDESDDDQAFGVQQWTVSANSSAGVTVTFETDQPFTNTSDSTFQRDAKLDLAVSTTDGPATWNVTQATSQTNFAGNVDIASVQADSDGVGLATFDLTVTFITEQFGVFAAGDYATTVTGTVTAN